MILKRIEQILLSRYFGLNLLGIICWFFAILLFGVQGILTDPKAEIFKAKLFTFVTSLLFVWAILNEFSDMLLPDIKKFIIARCVNWIMIPAVVIYLVVSNGIFQMDIDSNFSAIPIIFQMYLILALYELASYLRRDIPVISKFIRTKRVVLGLVVRILIVLNIWLCAGFVISWGSWYRFINSGIVD